MLAALGAAVLLLAACAPDDQQDSINAPSPSGGAEPEIALPQAPDPSRPTFRLSRRRPTRRTSKGCYIEHRFGTAPAPPLTEDLARTEYAAQVQARQCLIDLGKSVPELPSYQVFEDALLGEARIIGIYGLAADAGQDLSSDPAVWQQCPDPLDTWGHNG